MKRGLASLRGGLGFGDDRARAIPTLGCILQAHEVPLLVFGRLMETVDIVKKHGGKVTAAACLVNRSGGQLPAMDFPFHGLVELNPETFAPDALPPDLAGTPAIKPHSR
jgi:hypothetical protein